MSLQGTSALNTIFDGRGHPRAVIGIKAAQQLSLGWSEMFVDSVTVRGARSSGNQQPTDPTLPRNVSGAGIIIGDYIVGSPVVSNCILTDNLIGVAIADNPQDDGMYPFGARPRIINNTFAWNAIGLWSGNLHAPQVGVFQSYARPVVHNNVFDSGIPITTPAYSSLTRVSGFEGLHANDLTVASRTHVTAGPQQIGIAFNAWEVTTPPSVNIGAGAGHWPGTAPSGGATTLPAPRVNIAAITNVGAGTPRGSLYVNDIFRNSGVGPPGTTFRGISPHDFRLVLQVSAFPTLPPGQQSPPLSQPLINQGLWLSPSYTAITMAHGEVIDGVSQRVGLPAAADYGGAVFHAWDLDAEGFGNPRVRQSAGIGIPGVPSDPEGLDIDLGADEADELIMAGYIGNTTIYSVEETWEFQPTQPPGGFIAYPSHTRHTAVYFFDVPYATGVARPSANMIEGRQHTWWLHVLARPDAIGGTPFNNYTLGNVGSFRHTMTTGSGFGVPPFMRNLHCDYAPHLLQYIYPIGTLPPYDAFGATPDIYAALPQYQSTVQGTPRDNPYLYHNPQFDDYHPHMTMMQSPPQGGPGFPPTSWVSSGALHPPVTTNLSATTYLYTDNNNHVLGPFPFGPNGACTGTTLAFGAWGFNDTPAGCPDEIPWVDTLPLLGLRFNCERSGTSRSNLQSFLVINGGDAEAQSQAMGGMKISATPAPGTELQALSKSWLVFQQQGLRSWLSSRGK